MFPGYTAAERIRWWQSLARLLVFVLLLKVLVTILLEYASYFPPDFDSAFLTGREHKFTTSYAAAFYTHLVCGPLALVIGSVLMASGGRRPQRALHRWLGRVQVLIVLLALVPSSLVMATQAIAGPIAGAGFVSLALLTGYAAGAAAYYGISRRFVQHQRWANRCFVLLVSPLVLRLVSGVLTVTQWESPAAYCWNAWLSWLVPLLVYELVWRQAKSRSITPGRALPLQS